VIFDLMPTIVFSILWAVLFVTSIVISKPHRKDYEIEDKPNLHEIHEINKPPSEEEELAAEKLFDEETLRLDHESGLFPNDLNNPMFNPTHCDSCASLTKPEDEPAYQMVPSINHRMLGEMVRVATSVEFDSDSKIEQIPINQIIQSTGRIYLSVAPPDDTDDWDIWIPLAGKYTGQDILASPLTFFPLDCLDRTSTRPSAP
jgi:hypothetical protein